MEGKTSSKHLVDSNIGIQWAHIIQYYWNLLSQKETTNTCHVCSQNQHSFKARKHKKT